MAYEAVQGCAYPLHQFSVACIFSRKHLASRDGNTRRSVFDIPRGRINPRRALRL
jgi:hypothetical protein